MNLYYDYGKNTKISGRGSDWVIDLVIEQNITVSKHKPLRGSIYIKLPKYLNQSRKGFIKIQNIDDAKYLKWCLVI